MVNLLTGDAEELGPWLAEHADVDAIDLTGAPPPGHGVRARGRRHGQARRPPAGHRPDWSADPGLARMTPFLETKTVWHPMGV